MFLSTKPVLTRQRHRNETLVTTVLRDAHRRMNARHTELPNQVETRSSLVIWLAALGGKPLQSLVLELVERVPSPVGLVETALTLLELAPETVAASTISTDNAHTDTSQVPYLRR